MVRTISHAVIMYHPGIVSSRALRDRALLLFDPFRLRRTITTLSGDPLCRPRLSYASG
jgi:hypothetical protein